MPIIYSEGPPHKCKLPNGSVGDVFECDVCGWMGYCRRATDSFNGSVWYRMGWVDRWLTRRKIKRDKETQRDISKRIEHTGSTDD